MVFFEISIFALDVFVSKNRPKGHGIWLFLVMESHEKSWKVMEFEVPKRVWTLLHYRASLAIDSARPGIEPRLAAC